ncbi:energy transducer TonB [Granulicella sp. WH15]|uniref:energy transducer TonB n=1 Tax=Granulicella sp. WH15 TaxID=2602070 RepID=UPI0013A538C8|nr:energy transducer TonB [Granulicella sp. WH15]
MKALLPIALLLASSGSPARAAAQAVSAQPSAAATLNDEPITPPSVVYPEEAKKARIQGVVVLEINVSAKGEVIGVRAVSGPEPLRQAAVDAYRHAAYRPLLTDGKPTPAIITTSVNFNLKELPPDTDQKIDAAFEPLHARCQTLSAQNSADAVAACQEALAMANRFSPRFETGVHATAYNDLVLALIAAKRKPEASQLGEEAVSRFVDLNPDVMHHSPAAATAFITRAEIRSLTNNLRGAEKDCLAAEEIIRSLLQNEAEVDKSANYRQQLRETMLLRAAVLDEQHKTSQAKKLREQARYI